MARNHAAAMLLLALAVFAAYANAFHGVFQFDDYRVIVGDPAVRSWHGWLADLGHGLRPLLKLTYTLNWLSGFDIAGFHLVNILIHVANSVLVLLLAREFIRRQPALAQSPWLPLLTALLFALHPIHSEAVTYVCGRSSSLMALFYLGGLLAYAAGRRRGDRRLLFLLAPLLFAVAVGVKEGAILFPLALLAWELGCGGGWKDAARCQWPYWLVFAAGIVFFVSDAHYWSLMASSARSGTLLTNLLTQTGAFTHLMAQWAWPLALNADPDLPILHSFAEAPLPPLLAGFALLLIPSLLRRRPWLGFALLWALLHLIPLYVAFPRADIASERQMYLAGWPLFLAVAAELSLWLRPKMLVAAAVVLAVALGSLTMLRNEVYRSEIAFWQDAAAKSPHKARTQNNLGFVYAEAGRHKEARWAYQAALRIDPGFLRARNNLAQLETSQGGEPSWAP